MKIIQKNILPKTSAGVENLGDPVKTSPAKFRFIRAFGGTLHIAINLVFFHLMRKFLGAELEELQDKIPPRPLPEITGRIRQELGADPDQLFAEFEKTPIASASLAQVHLARLHDGRQVAVKVQYVGIEVIARQDLRTIKGLLSFYGFFLRIKGLANLHSQFSAMINEELDFRLEAQHIETIAANFGGNPHVLFPKVIHELSSERVLTTEYMPGVSIADLEKLAELNIDRQALAERVVTAYCQMIFSDGIYHADPHPGNILVQPDGNIVFIDFGAVARLSTEMREGIIGFAQGILKRDNDQIFAALQKMGLIALHEDTYSIQQFVDYLYSRFLKQMTVESWNLSDIHVDMQDKLDAMVDFSNLGISLRELMETFQIPKDLVLLERTLLLLLGLCTHLSPTMNPMKTIRPYLEEFVFGKDKNWLKLIESTVKDIALSVITIPADIQHVLAKANRGELEVKVKGLAENVNLLYAVGHQLLYGLFVMFFGGFGYIAHSHGEVALSKGLFGVSAFFLLVLASSILRARRWQKRQ